MIKTLRITSFVAAALAGVLFVLVVLYGFRSDPEAERFLSKPGVIELFKARTGRERASAGQSSPLLNQAQDFARHLKPEVKAPIAVRGPQRGIPKPPGPAWATTHSATRPWFCTPNPRSAKALSVGPFWRKADSGAGWPAEVGADTDNCAGP